MLKEKLFIALCPRAAVLCENGQIIAPIHFSCRLYRGGSYYYFKDTNIDDLIFNLNFSFLMQWSETVIPRLWEKIQSTNKALNTANSV